MSKGLCVWIAIVLAVGLLAGGAAAATRPPNVTVTLNPSVPSPAPLNTNITWTATIMGGQQGHTYDYQFSAALQGQQQIVRDFDLPNSFIWVPWTVEGTYVVTVVVRDITSQPYIIYPPVSQQYVLLPIVNSPGGSAVNTTNHPLVALFSAGTVYGWPFHTGSLQREWLADNQHNQLGAVFLLQRQLPGGGNAAVHGIPDALGGVQQQF